MTCKEPNTRTHILNIGRRLTALRGYTGVGLSEILKEANVPKGSFYHYFASKEAYGCALLQEFVSGYQNSLQASLFNDELNGRQQLLSFCHYWRAVQLGDVPENKCLVVKLSAEIADLSDDMSAILTQAVQTVVNAIAQSLKRGIADGSVSAKPNPDNTAESIYHLWLGASLVAALNHSHEALDSAMHATETLLLTD